MINEPTFNASLVNQSVSIASMTQLATSGASMTNQSVSFSTPANISFGVLWSEQLQTWSGTIKTWRELSDSAVLTNL